MRDDINWKLSLLLDDELDPSEAIVLLEQIYQDSELLNKWYGYQTIRQALKVGGGIQPQPDFLERVRVALADEVLVVSSDLSRQGRWVFNFKRFNFGRWTVPMALAAIVAAFVVIASKKVVFDSPDSAAQLAVARPTQFGEGKSGQRISGYAELEDYYLLVHSEDSLYLTGPQHMLGYARIVSHGGR